MMEVPALSPEEVRAVAEEAGHEPVRAWKTAALCALAFAGFPASVALASLGWIGVAAGAPLLALSLTLLSVVVHECAHGTLTGRRDADGAIGTLAGLLSWTPFASYRRGHHAHHAWIGTHRDPTPSPRDPVPPRRWLDALVRLRLPVLFWSGVYRPYLLYDVFPTASRRRARHVMQYAVNVAAIAAVHGALAGWLGGSYFVLAALGFLGWGILYEDLFTLGQHVGLAPLPEGRARYATSEQVNFSRSFPLPLGGLFFHFNLHKEHHLFPELNFQLLPRVGEVLRARRPDVYAFTDELPGWVRRRRRSHEILSPSQP